jgi:hypothetical protein
MVLPKTVMEYEQHCEDVIEAQFDLLMILECLTVNPETSLRFLKLRFSNKGVNAVN